MTDDRARIEQAQRTADLARSENAAHEKVCDWRWEKLEERLDRRDQSDGEEKRLQQERHVENQEALASLRTEVTTAHGIWKTLVAIAAVVGTAVGSAPTWIPALVRLIRGA